MPELLHHRQPVVSLIYLLLLVLAGAAVFVALAYIIGIAVYGADVVFQSAQLINGEGNAGLGFLKLLQIFSSVGMFIVPALVFAKIENRQPAAFLQLNSRIKPFLILLIIALMVFMGPALEWTIGLNKQMQLPDFMAGLENWMRAQEHQLEKLTIKFLQVDDIGGLLLNLLMIAVLPAIGEEFLFRGCLQKIVTQWTGSYHWGIWLAAIIFSTIHLQFYGFFPRMFLGALFGYLLVWSGSMWLPVLAHFINNAAAVVSAYVYVQKGESLEKLGEPLYDENSFMPLLSLLLTVLLLWAFYSKSVKSKAIETNESRLG